MPNRIFFYKVVKMNVEGKPLTEEDIKEVEKAFELIDESIKGLLGGEDEQKLPKNTNNKRQRKAQTVLQKTGK